MDDVVSVQSPFEYIYVVYMYKFFLLRLPMIAIKRKESRFAVGKLLPQNITDIKCMRPVKLLGIFELFNAKQANKLRHATKIVQIKIIFHIDFYPFFGVLQFDPKWYRPVSVRMEAVVELASKAISWKMLSQFNALKWNALHAVQSNQFRLVWFGFSIKSWWMPISANCHSIWSNGKLHTTIRNGFDFLQQINSTFLLPIIEFFIPRNLYHYLSENLSDLSPSKAKHKIRIQCKLYTIK